ncbi:uncharacterized protein N0V89_002228 [Didymosphaeria variabile]|uniref:Uncharacterized protein n=1 Tax=Didymosphaeria variabile TaxID=1932322 RepID=A0A9W9CE61_9PLEO|nr:uncharacterized protein N0V89_002228 [Didymosphaeria variabile]KAJ4357652.1 hypothetical protein N0V89_002228 [Didymosphaeria variabile]
MLATSTFYPQHLYMPPRPSPLSERSANAVPRPFQLSMPLPVQDENKPLVPQRAYKPNPVVQTRDAATKRRRDMFFKRVQKGRDDKKWDARSDQIQRLDHISEQKRWEAEKARQAPQIHDDLIEEDIEEFTSSLPEQELEEVDYVLAQEEREMQELVASMEEEQDASQHYGSDDEDYDQLFIEYTSASALHQQQQQQSHHAASANFESLPDADAMDLS